MSKTSRIILIIAIEILILFLTYKINFILFIVYASISLSAGYVYFSMRDENENVQFKRTSTGKELALLFKGLKRYIHEYTLIKDKGIEYMSILEDYIPYALCLDESKAMEDFIKQNDEYRDIIYNRK